mgnify:CR=1 FL=1
MQGPSVAEYSQKMHAPPPPHGAKQNKRATFLSGALRRTKEPPPHKVRSGGSFMSEDAPERKVALGPDS